MTKPLSQKTIDIVTQCIPALKEHGVTITTEMYKRLLKNDGVAELFNQSHQQDGSQPTALAFALLAYAENIKEPAKLKEMIERIAEKHVSLIILPKHYPLVGEALLGALKHVLADAATDEVMEAWTEAYNFLADVFIKREAEIYKQHEESLGGWEGWRKFKVVSRMSESDTMTSFRLVPVDGKPVLIHKPGQYLGLKLDINGRSQRRNYSISCAPNDQCYRISVNLVEKGIVSEWFNKVVKDGTEFSLSDPSGSFVFEDTNRPVVFMTGGSGLTPIMSMIGHIIKKEGHPKIHYMHSTHSRGTEAFATYIRDLAARDELKADIFYTRDKKPTDLPNVNFHEGYIPEEFIETQIPKDAVCYICGPQKYTVDMVKMLSKKGLKKDQIRFELFGSVTDLELVTE